jgi:hypothetical protein
MNIINTEPKPYADLWSIAENWSNGEITDWTRLNLFLHPMQKDGSMRGNDLFEFFKEKKVSVLNASAWEYLKTNQNEIPESWKYSELKGAQYIFFWGTIDRSPSGDLYVRYLAWSGGNWLFSNFLLSGNWHEDFPALTVGNVTVGL